MNARGGLSWFKRPCVVVTGGGGVGKTTTASALAVALARQHKSVAVVTVDPAKRLAEAFGFQVEDLYHAQEPQDLSDSVKEQLKIPKENRLYVGILNPNRVVQEVVKTTLSENQAEKLTSTRLFQQLSQMIYGLQEYAAFEWVNRLIESKHYDVVVLDTPPAVHAKDFFKVPDRIENLLHSQVFQIFDTPKTSLGKWVSKAMSFSWVEVLLGAQVFQESRLFFSIFSQIKNRVITKVRALAQFFRTGQVALVTVVAPHAVALQETLGLKVFLGEQGIPLDAVILNQGHPPINEDWTLAGGEDFVFQDKLRRFQAEARERGQATEHTMARLDQEMPEVPKITLSLGASDSGLALLSDLADQIESSERG